MPIYEEIELYENTKRLVLVPITSNSATTKEGLFLPIQSDYSNVVVIDRDSGNINKVAAYDEQTKHTLFSRMKSMTKIYGIYGVIPLLSGPFLVVITEREHVGSIREHKIYLLKKVQFLPFHPAKYQRLDAKQKEREIAYLDMINRVLTLDTAFYFSYTLDMTLNFQKISSLPVSDPSLFYKSSNPQFFWNGTYCKTLISSNLNGFIMPVIRGLVTIATCNINKKKFTYAVVSRNSCKRAGTRYNMRGADLQGNVANYVETEQIVVYGEGLASYVILRGSIPLIWTQYANLKYTPEIKFLTDKVKQATAFKNHFDQFQDRYGERVILVNLCKKHGQEKRLSDGYESFWKNTKTKHPIRYVTFDFHAECKHMNFGKIIILLEDIKEDIKNVGYYLEQRTNGLTAPTISASKSMEFSLLDVREMKDITTSIQERADMLDLEGEETPSTTPTASNPNPQPATPSKTTSQPPTPSKGLSTSKSYADLLDFDDVPKITTSGNEDFEVDFGELEITSKPTPTATPGNLTTQVIKQQKGAFRVNCIDCCDRTNVVQTYISKTILKQQLLSLGILDSAADSLSNYTEFEVVFNHHWADNGDRISLMYSGTGALMGDYTRTGTRSVGGLLADGFNSAMRYVKNNFQDSYRQRSINLVCGVLDLNSQEEIQAFQSSDIVSELFSF